jgi:hypothetical protein
MAMTDAELWAAWRLWMGVAAVVVIIAAALLVFILLTARRILADAGRALVAVEAIRMQTQPIWGLQDTNDVTAQILATTQAVEQKSTSLAAAVSGTEAVR